MRVRLQIISFKMSFQNFSTRHSHSFGGEYLELRPSERLKYTDKFDNPKSSRLKCATWVGRNHLHNLQRWSNHKSRTKTLTPNLFP